MNILADTSLIPPYDDYSSQDINFKEKNRTYDFERFFVGELHYTDVKHYRGIVCDILHNGVVVCKTVLSCFYRLTDHTYYCLFDGRKYSKEDISDIVKLKNFVPIYSIETDKYVAAKDVIKLFDSIFLKSNSFNIVSYKYSINNFFYGDLRLKIFSEYPDRICGNNIANHILLNKFKTFNCGMQIKNSEYDKCVYTVYKTIFYTNTINTCKAYCLNDNQVYDNVNNFDVSNDKTCGNFILLADKLDELNIRYNRSVNVKDVLEYQKKIYIKQKKFDKKA